jgi:putative ATP-dependent endonuclease of OLD family
VEGQSEYRILPEFARLMKQQFDIHGVCCVEFSQFGKLDMIINLADDLGIEWHVLTDNDAAGQGYAQLAINQLNGRDQQDHLTVLPDKDIEHFLWNQGYDYIFKQSLSHTQLKNIGITVGDPKYPSRIIKAAIGKLGKPALATEIAIEASKTGTPGVPTVIKTMLQTAVSLAEGSV